MRHLPHQQAGPCPFPQQALGRSTEPLQLLHSDICGPITPPTPSGNRYFLLLVDDYSRYVWICLLPTKDAAAAAIKRVQAAAECKSGKKLLVLRTDRGGEFAATDFIEYCAELGVHRQLTVPYTPQQNGVVERRNQSVVGTARSMLKAKGLPGKFWGEAVTTAVYLLNRSSSKSMGGKTPYELWTGSVPGVQHLRTFGYVAHMKVTTPNLKKLDDRSRRTIFVGYEPGSKAYRVYDPVSQRVHVSRDLVFEEAVQWSWTQGQRSEVSDFTAEHLPLPGSATTTASTSSTTSSGVATTSPTPPASPAQASPAHGAGSSSSPA